MIEILLSLYENRLIDLSELALHYGMSKRTIEKDISFLRRKGFIIFHGPRKTGRYVLTDKGKEISTQITDIYRTYKEYFGHC